MKPELATIEVQPDALLMLREFVEYNGIEYYRHNDALYKLLDSLADEVVRITTDKNGTEYRERRVYADHVDRHGNEIEDVVEV